MAVTYNTILRQIALSVNAITGATPSALETSYSTVPLTSANFQSSILSFTALKDKMLDAESEIVTTIAATGDHPYRASLISQTGALVPGSLLQNNAAGSPIIGVIGDVRDFATSQPCTKNELRQIQDRILNPTIWLVPVYWYCVSDRRIYHTTTSVVVDVVTYSRPVADSLALTTNITLPDDAVPAYINGALMQCIRDDEFMAQGARFGERFNQWVAQVKSGYTSIDSTSQIIQKAA